MTVVVLAVLGLWLVASLGNQIKGPWTPALRPFNWCSLLPRLDFFAPNPIDVDYHLAYHDIGAGGEVGPWRGLRLDHDGPGRVLWSPAKRDHQSLLAAVGGLALFQEKASPHVRDPAGLMQLSLPYLFLLNLAQHAPAPPASLERQFMIVESSGFGGSRRLALGILSNYHRLDRE